MQSSAVVLGAGSIGLSIGARLARAGANVLFVTRREEAARAIEADGVEVKDPATGERWSTPARAIVGTEGLSEAAPGEAPILLCVRASETETIARTLAQNVPGATVVSAQNDVDNEAKLACHFANVLGMVFRQTCTQTGVNQVLVGGQDRIILGRHSGPPASDSRRQAGDVLDALHTPTQHTLDTQLDHLARAFRHADFEVAISRDIIKDKWLKLCVNLMSAPNALVRKSEHQDEAFVEIKLRLLEEARDTLAASGIEACSCDGRDRSLTEEIQYHRNSIALGKSARSLPLYNAVWGALRHPGKSLEADLYHERILALANASGTAVPTHARVLEQLVRAYQGRLGPECLGARDLLAN